MTDEITAGDLREMLLSADASAEKIQEYFEIEVDEDSPFTPKLTLKEEFVDLGASGKCRSSKCWVVELSKFLGAR